MNIVSSFVRLVAVASCIMLASCGGTMARYVTPGRPADFNALGLSAERAAEITDSSIATRLARKPAAGFPAAIAIAQVQDRGYSNATGRSYGNGRYSLVTIRDAESEQHIKDLASLPMIRGLAPLNRFVVSPNIDTIMDLRNASAELQADMLLLYTFDTQFLDEKSRPILGTISLGLFNNRLQSVTSTASAALIDTRTGYIYGLAESTARKERSSNYWNSETGLDKIRRETEAESFGKLVTELKQTWTGVVAMYGPPATTVPASNPQ